MTGEKMDPEMWWLGTRMACARTPKKRDVVVSQPLSGEEQFPAGFPRFRYKHDSKLHEKTNSCKRRAPLEAKRQKSKTCKKR